MLVVNSMRNLSERKIKNLVDQFVVLNEKLLKSLGIMWKLL